MAPRLHHIGIAVPDIARMIRMLEEVLDLSFSPAEDVETQKVRVSFARAEGCKIELIEARSENSPSMPLLPHPIASYLKKHGAGAHHLCFSVPDLDSAIKRISEKDIGVLGEGAFSGHAEARSAFLDPNSFDGLLIELREEKDD